ncbi:hypothetical protein BS50DRAFT_580193 [Corynespora cassiicola Philippines]|uniref:Uncharacterized protein n=1 Tax=Corynespora cassiicola Philippines TaxID=1448308 RepID=A0A2T2N2C1_CORCC|nr:hypothetical protein BS50DRAFT_580193 [Corynespora cassiicola Philippines]
MQTRVRTLADLWTPRFLWRPRDVDEETNHVTSYPFCKDRSLTRGSQTRVHNVIRQCLGQEPGSSAEHPLHGMLNEALTRTTELHGGNVYVSILSPPKDDVEKKSEETTRNHLLRFEHTRYCPILLDPLGVGAYTSEAIDAAADYLVLWLMDQQRGNAKHV